MNDRTPRTFRTRQVAKVLISPEVLKKCLFLPEGTKIIVASSDWQSRDTEEPALSIVLTHPDIPATPDDGRPIPIANVEWRKTWDFYQEWTIEFMGWGL
jgi:hypothetical protein